MQQWFFILLILYCMLYTWKLLPAFAFWSICICLNLTFELVSSIVQFESTCWGANQLSISNISTVTFLFLFLLWFLVNKGRTLNWNAWYVWYIKGKCGESCCLKHQAFRGQSAENERKFCWALMLSRQRNSPFPTDRKAAWLLPAGAGCELQR